MSLELRMVPVMSADQLDLMKRITEAWNEKNDKDQTPEQFMRNFMKNEEKTG